MQLTLRNLIGYLTILCMGLAIFRRPILYFIEQIISFEQWVTVHNEFWFFWYIDLYLLGIEGWWPFELHPLMDTKTKLSDTGMIGLMFFAAGLVIWIILHVISFLLIAIAMKDIFWPTNVITDEEAEELLAEDEDGDEVAEEVKE